MIRFLTLLLFISLTGSVFIASAQDQKKTEKKAAVKKAEKKKPAAKKQAAGSQDWGRFSSGGKKDLDAQAKKDAAKKKQP